MELNEEIVGKFINELNGPVKVCVYYTITRVTPKLIYATSKRGEEVKFKKTEIIEKLETNEIVIDSIKCNTLYKILKKRKRG